MADLFTPESGEEEEEKETRSKGKGALKKEAEKGNTLQKKKRSFT